MFDQLTNWTQCTCCNRNFEHRDGCIRSITAIFYCFFLISPLPILSIGKKIMK